jgi:hypothetical protein
LALGETNSLVMIQLGPGQMSVLAAKAACTPLNTNITDMSAATLTNNRMRFFMRYPLPNRAGDQPRLS